MSNTELTATQALREAGFGHRKIGRPSDLTHTIYNLKTGVEVAQLTAFEVWSWLRNRSPKHTEPRAPIDECLTGVTQMIKPTAPFILYANAEQKVSSHRTLKAANKAYQAAYTGDLRRIIDANGNDVTFEAKWWKAFLEAVN